MCVDPQIQLHVFNVQKQVCDFISLVYLFTVGVAFGKAEKKLLIKLEYLSFGITVLQVRRSNKDNLGIISTISP